MIFYLKTFWNLFLVCIIKNYPGKIYYDDGKIMSENLFIDHNTRIYTYWFQNGNKSVSYRYKNDVLHGIKEDWISSGNRMFMEQRKNWQIHGVDIQFIYTYKL